LNLTDIHTTWVETRAVMGKSQHFVQEALEHMRQQLPFRLHGIDSDNGSEFINHHLRGYCTKQDIQFTRGRPYKKDDNAHIEQKNWTHVRKLLGYLRYDSDPALTAMNALYEDLRLLQNLFLPSVKLIEKKRVGARIRRRYDAPRTPLERVEACADIDGEQVRALHQRRARLDPIALAARIDQQLTQVYRLANQRVSPAAPAKNPRVDAAGPVDAQNASTRSLENRTERGFQQRPHASQSMSTSVTRLMARRNAAR
jgi:transposase InsO family protein